MTRDGRTLELLRNRFDRRSIAPGIAGWVYEYRNRAPIRIPEHVSTGFELGVQMSGSWLHTGSRSGKNRFDAGMVHTISPAERFTYSFQTDEPSDVLVGFAVYPIEVPELAGANLVFAPGAPKKDARLFAFCRAFRDALDREMPVDSLDVRGELLRFIGASCEVVPGDPLLDAKAEIDRHFNRPLYLRHVADLAGMHPTTFSRAFARRFGLTPTRYRLELRLNEALRLGWSRPDLSVRAIASEVGFEDPSYFHRAFQAKFWMTPASSGRRHDA
ncbi:MAG: hypothetical protein QOI41_1922 [Myxococcales bacterium]|nr:hypothetical protein [Myxococcales bacterium]